MPESLSVCPHCGDKLPWIVDAFCPSCGNRPDEPPLPPAPAGSNPETPSGHSTQTGSPLAVLILFAGVLTLFPTILAAARGNPFEAVYLGAVGVAMIFGGLMSLGRKDQSGRNRPT